MNCSCRDRSKPRPHTALGTDHPNEESSKRKERTRNSRNGQEPKRVDFHQAISKIKHRLDSTFRTLEGGLHDVEKGVNLEVADVLAKVIEFEESMKPKLLIPYKRCKELEHLLMPVISHVPKRSVSARNRSQQRNKHDKERCESAKPQRTAPSSVSTLGKCRFQELMSSPSFDRVNPWEGEDKWRASNDQRNVSNKTNNISNCSANGVKEDDVKKTMQDLQSISVSVNKSLKRITDKFAKAEGYQELGRAVDANPIMFRRVNESLVHIGAGAKLLKILLEEERRLHQH